MAKLAGRKVLAATGGDPAPRQQCVDLQYQLEAVIGIRGLVILGTINTRTRVHLRRHEPGFVAETVFGHGLNIQTVRPDLLNGSIHSFCQFRFVLIDAEYDIILG